MKKTFLLVAALAATSTLLAQDDLVIYGDVTSGRQMYRKWIIQLRMRSIRQLNVSQ